MSAVEGFDQHVIGTRVVVTKDDGTKFLTRTRSQPWIASGTTIVKVDGITGGYDIERIRLVTRDYVQDLAEYTKEGKERFGSSAELWRWLCPSCDREQSVRSIRFQMEILKQPSQRFGILKKGDNIQPEAACYAPNCNWSANGLFSGPITVVLDPSKTYDPARRINCSFAFAYGEIVKYDCGHCGFEQNQHGNCEGCGQFVRKIHY